MKLFSVAALCTTLVAALDTQSYQIIHKHRHMHTEYWPEPMENKQAIAPPGWKRLEHFPADQMIELQLSVAKNDKVGIKLSHWKADPHSKWYEHEYTDDEIFQLSSYPEGPGIICDWLSDHGIATNDDQCDPHVEEINVNMTIAKAEELLHTRYRFFQNLQTQEKVVGTTEWSVPKNVTKYVGWAEPTFVGHDLES